MKPHQIAAILLDEAFRPGLGHGEFKPGEPQAERPEPPVDPKDWIMRKMPTASKEPYIRIKFLDGAKETIHIPCEWTGEAYFQGSSGHPGVIPHPTPEELRMFNFPGVEGTEPGEFAMEVLHSNRYEGDERFGIQGASEDVDYDEEGRPYDWNYRPFRWRYFNDDEEIYYRRHPEDYEERDDDQPLGPGQE